MLVYFSLSLYILVPIAALYLRKQKSDEGKIWLLFLGSGFLAFILLFLNPISLDRSDSPYIWYSSSSLILTFALQWEKTAWTLQVFFGFFVILFLAQSYLEREKQSLSIREMSFIWFAAAFGIMGLISNQLYFLISLFFCLDSLQLIDRFLDTHELFPQRWQIMSTILRLISVVMMLLVATWVDINETFLQSTNHFLMIGSILLIRIAAQFLDSIHEDRGSDFLGELIALINALFLLKMLSILPQMVNLNKTVEITLWGVSVLLILGFVYLWIRRSRKNKGIIFSTTLAILFGSCFFLKGVREEMLFLILPIFFSLINPLLNNHGKASEVITALFEGIFLIGYTFSPLYFLNKSVLISSPVDFSVILLLVLEGFYLACFFLPKIKPHQKLTDESLLPSLIWVLILVTLFVVLKGFLPLEPFGQISWLAFLPWIGLALILLSPLVFSRRKTDIEKDNFQIIRPTTRIFNQIVHLALIIVNIMRQVFEGTSALLEGKGGLVWAIIFLVLLLTFYKGLAQI